MRYILNALGIAYLITLLMGCSETSLPLIVLNIDSEVVSITNQPVVGNQIEVKKEFLWKITSLKVQDEYKSRIPTNGIDGKLEIEFSNDNLREKNEDLNGANFGDILFTKVDDKFESPIVFYINQDVRFEGMQFKIFQDNMDANSTLMLQEIKLTFISENATIRINDSPANSYSKPVYVVKTSYENTGFVLSAGGTSYGNGFIYVPVGVQTLTLKGYEPLTNNIVIPTKTFNENSSPKLDPEVGTMHINFYDLTLEGYGFNQGIASQARVVFEITYLESRNYNTFVFRRGIDFSDLSYFEVANSD